MIIYSQAPRPEGQSPYIFEEGETVHDYRLNLYEETSGDSPVNIPVILITKIEGKRLVCVQLPKHGIEKRGRE